MGGVWGITCRLALANRAEGVLTCCQVTSRKTEQACCAQSLSHTTHQHACMLIHLLKQLQVIFRGISTPAHTASHILGVGQYSGVIGCWSTQRLQHRTPDADQHQASTALAAAEN